MVKLYATESVSPSDRMDGRSESSRLKEHIITIITERGTTHFQYDFADVLDKTQFDRRMAEVELAISGEMENNDILPFLHISCHGTTDHLKFTNGEIFWDDLTKLIRRLTARCTGNLVLCISACSGIAASSIGGNPEFPLKCLIIGPKGRPTWDQCYDAFSWLYESIITSEPVPDQIDRSAAERLVSGMNNIINQDDLFQYIYLDEHTENLISILKQNDIEPATTVGLTRSFAKLVKDGQILPEQIKIIPRIK